MNRRQFIFMMSGAAALLGAPRAGRAECGESTNAEFVEGLYEMQARLLASNVPLAGDKFYALFSRDLRELMQAPRPHLRDEPIGRLLNAFFGWGIMPGTEVEIGKVALASGSDDGPATVSVEVKNRGGRHKVWVRVVRENEVWRIANISYDSGKSLADHYREITRR